MWLKSTLFFPFIVVNRRRLILNAQFLLIRLWFFFYLKLSSKCTRLPRKGFDKLFFFLMLTMRQNLQRNTNKKKFGVIFYQVVKKKLLHFHHINPLSNVIDYIFHSFVVPFPGKKIKNISHDVVLTFLFCIISFLSCFNVLTTTTSTTYFVCCFVEILFAFIFLHRIINI